LTLIGLCDTKNFRFGDPMSVLRLDRLRTLALGAMLVGAGGAAGFLLRAGRHTPRLLLAIMAAWVLAPFGALICAGSVAKRWPAWIQETLIGVMLAVSLGSLAMYTFDASRPRTGPAGFVFVMVPLASWLFLAVVLSIAALVAKRQRSKPA
jgi:hypothetical protein